MIRTYNKIKYTDENGIVTHTLPQDVGSIALCVTNTIKGKWYSVKPMRRIVCSCGCVDQYESTIADVICPKCGCVVKHQPNQHSRWGIGGKDFNPFILEDKISIQDNMIVAPMITINIDGINSEIDIVRNNVAIAEVIQNSGYRLFNFSHDFFKEKNEKLIALAHKMMKHDVLWEKATDMIDEVVQISQRNGYYGAKSNGFGNGIYGIVRLYNVFNLLPWTQILDTDYLAAIFCFEFQSPVKSLIKSEDDYFTIRRIPKFLARVYPICGFPDEPLEYMDQLNDDLKSAIISALMHKHVNITDLRITMNFDYSSSSRANNVNKDRVDALNMFGKNFADFFRKHVIEYGKETYDTFLLLDNSHQTSIKELNLLNLEAYLIQKKKVKVDRIKNFEDFVNNGDMISAIGALVG